ncbi:TPA: hypothetical protein ACSIXH_003652 [Acinetobacter baumannii]
MKLTELITVVILGAISALISSYITYKQAKKLYSQIQYRKQATGR